ncbi:MAG: hypothetical protein Q4G29_00015 [Pseudoscardovia radai]|nr:hypothetical protein [Pseudoscardovia radai]
MSDQNNAWTGAWGTGGAAGQRDAVSGATPESAYGAQPDANGAQFGAAQFGGVQLGGARNAAESYVPDTSAPAYAAGYAAPVASADVSATAWQTQPTVAYGQQDVRYVAQDGADAYGASAYMPEAYEAPLAPQPQYAAPQNTYQAAAALWPAADPQPVFAPQPALMPQPVPAPQPVLAPAPMPAAPKDALPVPTAAPTSVKKPMSSKRRAVIALIAALVVALIVGGIVFHNLAVKRGDANTQQAQQSSGESESSASAASENSGPKATIQQYLSLLEAGDYGQAANMADPGLSDEQKVLLRDGIVKDASKRVSSTSIDSVSSTNDTDYTADISYTLDGKSYSGTIELSRSGSSSNPTWTFKESLVGDFYIPVVSNTDVTVSGIGVTEDNVDNGAASRAAGGVAWEPIAAYPGVYELGVTSRSKYVDVTVSSGSDGTSMTVGGDATKLPTVSRSVNDLLVTDLRETLTQHLDTCVANANAGKVGDKQCYINSMHVRNFYGGSEDYVQKEATVTRYPELRMDSAAFTAELADDGSISGNVPDNSYVTVHYTYKGADKDMTVMPMTTTASYELYEYTVSADGTIDIKWKHMDPYINN